MATKKMIADKEKIKKIIAIAESLLGAPYKRGAYAERYATKQSAFDCSSLIQYIYKKVGIDLPRSSILQAAEGVEIKHVKNIKPGDLIFFEGSRGHYWHVLFGNKKLYIGHVALYVGKGKIIDAQEDRGGVAEISLREVAKKQFYKIALIKRVIGSERPLFKVPAYSQFLDITKPGWQGKSCGIVALKMVMDFWGKKKNARCPSADRLLNTGLKSGAYIKNIGWSHKGLVRVAKKYGISGENFDWARNSPDDAFSLLKTKMSQPVIASICKNLRPSGTGHLIVISGIKNKLVYYNDPDSKDRKKITRVVSLGKFLLGWKRRVIVINPQQSLYKS